MDPQAHKSNNYWVGVLGMKNHGYMRTLLLFPAWDTASGNKVHIWYFTFVDECWLAEYLPVFSAEHHGINPQYLLYRYGSIAAVS